MFRHAIRTLRKSPGFSILVIAVLAVGIGANTAIFTIVDGVLLKPLPFQDPTRLVAVDTTTRNEPDDTSYPDFLDWRTQTTTLERLAVFATNAMTLTGTGEATSLSNAVVTADLFTMFGVRPLVGRVFEPADDQPGAPRAVILTEGLWSSRFARDSGIVGRSITLDGEAFTVVGVMPASFEFPFTADDPVQLWTPVLASSSARWANQRDASFLHGIGRLKDGVTIAQAQAELSTIAGRLAAQYPRNQRRGIVVRPYQEALVKDFRVGLAVLWGAVAAVLLIACANLANLLLARGSTRRREIAVRVALGASRAQILRQLLVESLVLAAVGGIAGVAIAVWGADLLVRVSPLQIPRLHAVHVDRTALLFAALASAATGILSGLVPALQLSRSDPNSWLKDGERGGSGSGGARTRQVLVVAEMAISLVLLASAGLLVRSLVALQRVNPGFVSERAVAMQLLLPHARYTNADAMRSFYRRLRDEARTMPGVSSSAVATTMPLSGSDIGVGFTIEGRPADPGARTSAAFWAISPDYFSTMGIPVMKGRTFTDRDSDRAPDVVIINEAFAAKYWPFEDPLGRRITIGYNNTGPREVVGIVGDVKQGTLADPARPQMYAPFEQTPWPFVVAVVRTPAAPESAAASLRAMLARIDPLQGVGEIRTLEAYVARASATPRFTAWLVGGFAAFALLLAGFGLFSVMAYSVAQRRREIGIRMALGAQPSDVRAMVVRQAIGMAAVGVAIGLAGALGSTRVLESLLFTVRPHDPATFAVVSAVLVGVMLLAAYLPAARATRVDPLIALRTE
jgi:putative ABC transport system permease protein